MKRTSVLLGVILLAAAAVAQTNLSLPAGTAFTVKLDKTLSTFMNKEGDPFSGRTTAAIMLDGKTAIPAGAVVEGRITKLSEPRRIAGKPTIGLFVETLVLPGGERHMMNAAVIDTNLRDGSDVNTESQFKGSGHDAKDITEAGFGTGGGMLIGGLAGGPAGLAIGGTVGATVTVAHWLGKKRSAVLPSGTLLTLELSRPLDITPASEGQ